MSKKRESTSSGEGGGIEEGKEGKKVKKGPIAEKVYELGWSPC
jgi:hypothetical protein